MHRLRSRSAVVRFRIAALLLCARFVLYPATAGLLAYSLIITNRHLMMLAIGLAGLAVMTVLLQWIVAQRTNCPLCITPVLANRQCSKNRRARTFMGSHRLRVALAILFRNSFRCPYCNEPTVLEVRNRLHYPPYSRG